MLRRPFEQKQRHLRDKVLVLGSQISEGLVETILALKEQDSKKAGELMAGYSQLRKRCAAVEAETLALLATQQPMASDLRLLAGALEVTLELERIGRHSREIGEIVFKLYDQPLAGPFGHIIPMAGLTVEMLQLSLEAFAKQDVTLAKKVPVQDDAVDHLYQRVCDELLGLIKNDREMIPQAIYLSQVAHQLERVADRTTNICEWVIFIVTGEMSEQPLEQV